MTQLSIPCRESVPSPDVHGRGISVAELVALRSDMVRFAQLQVRDSALAEDLVQDSIEAALRKSSSFAGSSSQKTWVFAILRNRIIDHLRTAIRSVNVSSLATEGADLDDFLGGLFNSQGNWRVDLRPASWPTPDEAMQSRQFWAVLEECLKSLPAQSSRVFMMREVLGLETSEICKQLGISTSNCHVILHRARMKLRSCLESDWARDLPDRLGIGKHCGPLANAWPAHAVSR